MKIVANILYLVKVFIAWGVNWFMSCVAMYYFCDLIKADYTWQIGTALWVLLLCCRYVRKTCSMLLEDSVWAN